MPAASRQPNKSAIASHRTGRSGCLVVRGAARSDGMRSRPQDATAARRARRIRRPRAIGRAGPIARSIPTDPFSGGATLTIDTVEDAARSAMRCSGSLP